MIDTNDSYLRIPLRLVSLASNFMSLFYRKLLFLLFLAASVLFPFHAYAEQPIGDATLSELNLLPFAKIIKEPKTGSTMDKLLLQPGTQVNKHEKIISFGFSNSVYWFIIPINNEGTQPLDRILLFNPTWLDDIQVTLIHPDGRNQFFQGGDFLPFFQRSIPHQNINFELSLQPGISKLLVRTQTSDPYLVQMTLWEKSSFFEDDGGLKLYLGLIYGVIFAMLLYNLMLFLSIRETMYAAYAGYLLSFLLMHSTYNGHLYHLVWPNQPIWGNWAHSVFIYLYVLSGLFFAISFLELRLKLHKLYRQATGLGIIILISFFLTAIFGGYTLHVRSSILWVFVYAPFVLYLGLFSLLAGNRSARFFLTAAVAGFIGSFITASTVTGIIAYTFFTYHAVDIGMLIDAVLLSLALADRLRLARGEMEQTRIKLLETIQSYANNLEKEISEKTKELSEANTAKDKFLSIVGHDLRGPIGGLSTLFNQVIESTEDFTDEMLQTARAATRNTSEFINQLFTWARCQRGDIKFQPETFDLAVMLMEIQQLFSVQAKEKNIQMNFHIQGSFPVYADREMIHTVLRNLTSNALKFTHQGGSIHAGIENNETHFIFQITDTGVGMTQEIQEGLFRLDVKPQSTPGTKSELGTGLGLILCSEFVLKNGGLIGVSSEKDIGSRFWFTLPKNGVKK